MHASASGISQCCPVPFCPDLTLLYVNLVLQDLRASIPLMVPEACPEPELIQRQPRSQKANTDVVDNRASIPLFVNQSFSVTDSVSLENQSLDDIAPFGKNRSKAVDFMVMDTLQEEMDLGPAPTLSEEPQPAASSAGKVLATPAAVKPPATATKGRSSAVGAPPRSTVKPAQPEPSPRTTSKFGVSASTAPGSVPRTRSVSSGGASTMKTPAPTTAAKALAASTPSALTKMVPDPSTMSLTQVSGNSGPIRCCSVMLDL